MVIEQFTQSQAQYLTSLGSDKWKFEYYTVATKLQC